MRAPAAARALESGPGKKKTNMILLQIVPGGGEMLVDALMTVVVSLLILGYPLARIAVRQGHSGWIAVAAMSPYSAVFALWYVALAAPREREAPVES